MDFQIRAPRGLHSDEVGKQELVFVHNEYQSSIQLLTYDELERLADVIEHALAEREMADVKASADGAKLSGRCEKHPAFDADYCPACGTAAKI